MRLAALAVMTLSSAALAEPQPTYGNEVIEIHGHANATMPRPHRDQTLVPPYTDAAALSDTWNKAWLMLDVDATGVVRRVKFLKHAGYGLDPIAVDWAFRQTFDPARDKNGAPAASLVVYPVEWPSHDWLVARTGTTTRMLTPIWGWYGTLALPPCKGSGPLQLESVDPVYRDCSVPNLAHADASERWITR